MIPGVEPILLDLEKLLLLSDSMENLNFYRIIEISEPEKKSKKKSDFFLRSQVATYTVFHEESESEVEKCKFLRPEAENRKN